MKDVYSNHVRLMEHFTLNLPVIALAKTPNPKQKLQAKGNVKPVAFPPKVVSLGNLRGSDIAFYIAISSTSSSKTQGTFENPQTRSHVEYFLE